MRNTFLPHFCAVTQPLGNALRKTLNRLFFRAFFPPARSSCGKRANVDIARKSPRFGGPVIGEFKATTPDSLTRCFASASLSSPRNRGNDRETCPVPSIITLFVGKTSESGSKAFVPRFSRSNVNVGNRKCRITGVF